MGTQLETFVVALNCEVRECRQSLPWHCRFKKSHDWRALAADIGIAVAAGWAFSLAGRLLSYCPDHVNEIRGCRCRLGRHHRCVVHDPHMASLVWNSSHVPLGINSAITDPNL